MKNQEVVNKERLQRLKDQWKESMDAINKEHKEYLEGPEDKMLKVIFGNSK